MATSDQIQELLEKSEWSDADWRVVSEFLDGGNLSELFDLLRERFAAAMLIHTPVDTDQSDRVLQMVHDRLGFAAHAGSADGAVVPLRRPRFPWMVAAAVVVITTTVFYFRYTHKTMPSERPVAIIKHDVQAPLTSRATVTLTSGQKVFLDSVANGTLATQSQVKLNKIADGKITYERTVASDQATVVYNTLTNPRGSRVVDMTLADGSRVWLNAASSVTYPVSFAATGARKVSITGEAYFEVTHDASRPFIVTKGDMQVMVLGTHFNVNAYDDEENIKVTLLEGAVKINNHAQSILLKPGQQSQINGDNIKLVKDADIEQAMAWKNGSFIFKKSNIGEIMRQVSRWYDVDVEYESTPAGTFSGGVSRNTNVSNVMKILALSDVHFKIDGKKVILTK